MTVFEKGLGKMIEMMSYLVYKTKGLNPWVYCSTFWIKEWIQVWIKVFEKAEAEQVKNAKRSFWFTWKDYSWCCGQSLTQNIRIHYINLASRNFASTHDDPKCWRDQKWIWKYGMKLEKFLQWNGWESENIWTLRIKESISCSTAENHKRIFVKWA